MTIGYPDDQGYPQWVAPLLANFNQNVPISSSVQVYQGTLGEYASLHVESQVNANGAQVTITWIADAAFTIPVWFQTLYLSQLCTLNVYLPALAPYVQVNAVTTTSAVSTFGVQLSAANQSAPAPVFHGEQNYIVQAITSVAASTTATLSLPQVQPGLAWFYFEPQDSTGKLTVEVAVGPGAPSANNKIIHLTGPTTEVDRLIALPDVPVIINIINTDGAGPHSYRASLVPAGSTG